MQYCERILIPARAYFCSLSSVCRPLARAAWCGPHSFRIPSLRHWIVVCIFCVSNVIAWMLIFLGSILAHSHTCIKVCVVDVNVNRISLLNIFITFVPSYRLLWDNIRCIFRLCDYSIIFKSCSFRSCLSALPGPRNLISLIHPLKNSKLRSSGANSSDNTHNSAAITRTNCIAIAAPVSSTQTTNSLRRLNHGMHATHDSLSRLTPTAVRK